MSIDGRVEETSMNVNALDVTGACDNACMPDLVKVLSASSIMEGEIVKARLEGEGIPVLLKGGGSDPYGMGVAYVFVPSEFEAQARLVLEDVSDETSG
jgi:hypothetical protein